MLAWLSFVTLLASLCLPVLCMRLHYSGMPTCIPRHFSRPGSLFPLPPLALPLSHSLPLHEAAMSWPTHLPPPPSLALAPPPTPPSCPRPLSHQSNLHSFSACSKCSRKQSPHKPIVAHHIGLLPLWYLLSALLQLLFHSRQVLAGFLLQWSRSSRRNAASLF